MSPFISDKDQCCDNAITVQDTQELHCTAYGYPTPNIKWTPSGSANLDNEITNTGNYKMESVLSVSGYAGGIYLCTAYNGIGENSTVQRTVFGIKFLLVRCVREDVTCTFCR